jgi:hypothetical protein
VLRIPFEYFAAIPTLGLLVVASAINAQLYLRALLKTSDSVSRFSVPDSFPGRGRKTKIGSMA